MQTFLPHPDFDASARALDDRRLGKQRVEARQILNALKGWSSGWRRHPATTMWEGYEDALCRYGRAVCLEWRRRGFRDGLLEVFELFDGFGPGPWWLGDEAFHRAHRSNLIRKDPARYGAMWPDVPATLPYLWPTSARTFREI